MTTKSLLVLAAAATLSAATLPASAGDVQGDAYNCQELWVMRNQIYKDAGYCFTSPRAITYFGNGGCLYHSQSEVPLSDQQRQTIKMIKKSSARQSC
jgi:hypothetical protein